MLTYNNIIAKLQQFANDHFQINEFGNGDLWEVVESKQITEFNYPLLFAIDQPMPLAKSSFSMVFNVLVMDLVKPDESNENEVKSDTQQILLDLISYLDDQNDGAWYFVKVDRTSTLNSFTERFDDTLTGWGCTISLKQPFQYDACSIPIEDSPTPEIPLCPKDLFWFLEFNGTDDKIQHTATALTEGTFTSGSGANVGDIEISIDDVTFDPILFPLTINSGTTYYFTRSETTTTGTYTLTGTYE